MALPEFVAPVLAAGGPVALVAVVLRFGPDAVLRLVAGLAAVLTADEKRGRRCVEVLRALRGRDSRQIQDAISQEKSLRSLAAPADGQEPDDDHKHVWVCSVCGKPAVAVRVVSEPG